MRREDISTVHPLHRYRLAGCMMACMGVWKGDTHPEILVRHLLVFFSHCCGRGPRHHACECEEAEGYEEPDHGVAEDLHAFTWRGEGSGAVRTEGDVVCCGLKTC